METTSKVSLNSQQSIESRTMKVVLMFLQSRGIEDINFAAKYSMEKGFAASKVKSRTERRK